MHRVLVELTKAESATLSDAAQVHYIRDVLRLKVNDAVIIFDGAGHEFKGEITSIDKKQAVFKLTPLKKQRSTKVGVTIACAIPKGSHMDDIIDSLTQLGVESIIPMLTDRVVVKLDDAKSGARLKRWQKIAQSAAQQCQRSDIPEIMPVTDFKKVVAGSHGYSLKLIPHLAGKRKSIKDVLNKVKPKNVIVLIGPEGDFTLAEVELALDNGFMPVSLGDTVLRVGTAAVAVTAYIRLALDK
jgi:16S rRNA (uracil1498-N3)-methyltransferase